MFESELSSPILLALLALGFGLLLLGGWLLVEGAVRVAERMKVSKLVIGLTIVAFGTSSPELFFNIFAALDQHTGLAYGNVIGSNIANIGLVIGLSALAAPLAVNSVSTKRGLPYLTAISSIFALLYFVSSLLKGDDATATFSWEYGLILLLLLGPMIWWWASEVKKEKGEMRLKEEYDEKLQIAHGHHFPVGTPPQEEEQATPLRFLGKWITLVGGLAILLLGGYIAEGSAVEIAINFGVSDAVIGLTIVAIATTLPEIITCIIAALKRQSDLVMGTVIGSNLCNILLVMGVTSMIHPVPLPEDGKISMFAMLIFTVLLWIFAVNKSSKKTRGSDEEEVGTVSKLEGCILIAIYAVTIAWILV